MQEHVAPAAFHNSKQRVDPPRCHAHTRGAVLKDLFTWIVGNVPREACITWLNGPAGAGKSAICQSVTEMCIYPPQDQGGDLLFFRTDSTRNTMDPVIATLAYQIIHRDKGMYRMSVLREIHVMRVWSCWTLSKWGYLRAPARHWIYLTLVDVLLRQYPYMTPPGGT